MLEGQQIGQGCELATSPLVLILHAHAQRLYPVSYLNNQEMSSGLWTLCKQSLFYREEPLLCQHYKQSAQELHL